MFDTMNNVTYWWFMPKYGEAQLHFVPDGQHGSHAACGLVVRVAPVALPGAPISKKCPACYRAWRAAQEGTEA